MGCCDCRVKSTQKVLPRAGAAGGRWKYRWQLLQQICSSVPVPCWAWGGCFPSKPLAWLMWVWRSSVSQGAACTCRAAGQLPGCSKECWGRDLARHLGDIRDTRSVAKSRKKSLLCALLRLRFPPLQLRNFVQIFRWATQRNTLPGEENREVLRFFQRKVP